MPALHIRNVPEEAVERLKRRARRHGRSMQAELLQLVVDADHDEEDEPFEWHTVSEGYQGTWARSEIYGDSGR